MPITFTEAEEVRALIGVAVNTLLRAGQPVSRVTLVTQLHMMASQTADARQRLHCQKARELLAAKLN